jgi:DNA recombination protein RmuC
MRTLAQDVGGLKRVLSNVKTRGVLGEAQLGALLEQFLVPGQFEPQRRLTPGSREAVDFAVRLPGPGQETPVWIPIDAKFPLDDYQRLQDAQDRADLPALELAGRELEKRILEQARSIRDKYVVPPVTTPFALMFLPSEGLYAEVLRRPGLFERVQADFQVVVLGPTTLCAFLNTIQVGFANLAISQRSQEAWKVLGEVKAEFRRFGDWIEAAQRKLQAASEEMDKVGTRTRQMERRLKDVEALPPLVAAPGLELEAGPAALDQTL